ncbi:hypothetical protein FJV41_22360 [Myxococcus llanfairpwllgwyngyllgogerychwyrndrobwllllantysiliogogogochensis]|uniref:Holliday junction resolvase RuvC n=2 Tax=Myxococcus llanfairpwllgwyngyllgogerychwyrndrobwllllantysiliogogogochensis TaxID=2590453 RepID=A0A540WXJ6_9BACT|nr:hypothetical protein FJV41_22360 [Myxococcus llanfairpwllgwyngyllgogerychwyrndrobwllllantysiliogogogochensis]
MRLLLAIDPGLRECGIALFDLDSGELLAAGMPTNPERKARGLSAWARMAEGVAAFVSSFLEPLRAAGGTLSITVASECPQVYTAGKSKGDPNDLIELAGVVGRVAGALGATSERSYLPREWKGTLDGDVMVERIKARLGERPHEHLRVQLPRASEKHHNVWDAIGIGLHVVGRLAPRKVFPR